ncbi:hypothetical protein CPLU01_10867 [Colletotrichum plurivorum]|uniref:Uncharacterized protein n=1 Tax=Colletotrichum plurivorum TaxID=2175906 RepID=A0A8H6K4R3_9PEZI|nr:hypothetical protein CPLU01_10867 [Colletotrichum plurivorum]
MKTKRQCEKTERADADADKNDDVSNGERRSLAEEVNKEAWANLNGKRRDEPEAIAPVQHDDVREVGGFTVHSSPATPRCGPTSAGVVAGAVTHTSTAWSGNGLPLVAESG